MTASTPKAELRTVLRTQGNTRALNDGSITSETCRLECADVPVLTDTFRRMVRTLEFKVCEMALSTCVCARAHGKRFIGLPIFPVRAFHHGAILCGRDVGVQVPTDLEHRKVGVNRGYTVTNGVWARSILQHEYGVDLALIPDAADAADLPLTVEIPISLGAGLRDVAERPYTAIEWAKVAINDTRTFLANYARTKEQRAPA